MRQSLALLLSTGLSTSGGVACTSPNPAYEDSGPIASTAASSTTRGPDTGGPDATGPGDTAPTSSGGTADTTNGDPTTDTDPPTGCGAQTPPMGTLCHSVEVLELPDDCDPRPVLIADIIGDAHGDVLVACAEGPLLVFPGQPSGIGEPQMVTDMANAAGPMPLDLAVGYLDGDDRLDIVLVNGVVGEPNVRVFLQTNAGAFIVDPYDAGPRPNQVAIGAWSSPRAPDVFIATMDALVLGHLRNTGNGTFDVAPAIDVGIPQNDVALGRLDGDADVDIAVVSSSPNRLTLVFNQDGLPGGLVPIADNLGTMPTRLLLNDIEPNATLDILYTRGGASGIRVLRGDGSGNFSINEAQNYGDSLRDLDDGDFDGNGLPDAVLADYTGQVLFFLLLLEGPQMEVMDVMLPIDGQPWSLAAGRIDGDLLTDVVVSTDDTHQVVLVQSSP